jgi:murein DD-endopeptidase MepM/ murein hydrolase activator NlpD
MRNLLRTILCVLLGLMVAAPAGAARRRSHEPSAAKLQSQANEAASRLAKAESVYVRLDSEIARLERQVGGLRSRIVPLRQTVTRRVVALYQGQRGLEAVPGLAEVSDPMESARGARLVADASAGDLDAIKELAAASARAEERQALLIARKQEQQAARDRLQAERREVESKLMAMGRVGDLRHRIVATAQQRSSRSVRQAAAAPVPSPPAAVEVETSFVCPIVGPVAFADTWGDARSGGRRHQGTDLMSPFGTDNVAVVSGTFRRHNSSTGGLAIYLHGDDGHTYYYAHLSQVVGPDRRVAQGEVIAKTGNSGNARGGSPHTHFEFHPGGGPAVNSYPLLKAHC